MKKLLLSAFIFGSLFTFAQQDAQFTHYAFNSLYNNPAYAGVKGLPTFRLIHRSQWLGFQPTIIDEGGAPTSQIFSFEGDAFKGTGVGVLLMTDRVGPQRYSTAQLSLSQKVTEISGGQLRLGVQASYSLMQLGLSGYRPPEGVESIVLDGAIPDGKYSEGFFDIAAGAWYEHENFYAGFAINKLLDNDFSFTDPLSNGGFVKHMYISGGYYIRSVYDWVFQPTLLVKSSLMKGGARTQFDLGGIATYKEDMWGGLNFRQGEAISIMLGKSFMDNKQLKLGYALDLTIKGVDAKAWSSHEIMLAYNLPDPTKNFKPAIRTPRFRF